MTSPLDAMQAAVNIVLTSPHPTNKIASTLFTEDSIVARTNSWPKKIAEVLGTDTRIGNSSGTIHAEVNCLLDFPAATFGASLCVTDPFVQIALKILLKLASRKFISITKGLIKILLYVVGANSTACLSR